MGRAGTAGYGKRSPADGGATGLRGHIVLAEQTRGKSDVGGSPEARGLCLHVPQLCRREAGWPVLPKWGARQDRPVGHKINMYLALRAQRSSPAPFGHATASLRNRNVGRGGMARVSATMQAKPASAPRVLPVRSLMSALRPERVRY